MQTGGYDDVSMRGYSDDSPYRYNPYNLIQSNKITMARTGMDLMGVSDTGDVQYMPAYSGDYEFDGDEVMEYPVYQTFDDGLDINELKRQLDALKNTKKKFKTKKEENIFNTVLREKQASFNSIKELYRKANNSNYQNEAEKYIDEANKRLEYFKTISVENYQENPSPAGEGLPDFRFIDRKPGTQKKSNAVPPANTSNNKGFNVTYDNGVTEPLKEVSPGVYTNPKGSTWTKGEDGKFKFEPNPLLTTSRNTSTTNNTPPPNRGSGSGGRKSSGSMTPASSVSSTSGDPESWTRSWEKFLSGKGLIDDSKPSYSVDEIDDLVYDYVKNNPSEFNDNPFLKERNLSETLTDGKFGKIHNSFIPPSERRLYDMDVKPVSSRKINAPGVAPDVKLDTRFTKEGEGRKIQYSPKIEGITPETKPNPRFKLNTTNRLSSLFNLGRVTDGWAPISPGYYKDVDIRLPELMQYDPSAGLQTIADTYDPIINNISNDTAGIAAKSSFASKKADAQQKYVNSIEQQNMGLRNQYNTMMADLYYKVNASRQENAANYFKNIQQALANRALLKDKTKAGLEQSFAAEQFANTKIDNTVMENEGVVEVTKPLDSLLGRRILEVDREALNKKYLKVEEDKKTQEELLASVKMLLQQQKDQKATKLT